MAKTKAKPAAAKPTYADILKYYSGTIDDLQAYCHEYQDGELLDDEGNYDEEGEEFDVDAAGLVELFREAARLDSQSDLTDDGPFGTSLRLQTWFEARQSYRLDLARWAAIKERDEKAAAKAAKDKVKAKAKPKVKAK